MRWKLPDSDYPFAPEAIEAASKQLRDVVTEKIKEWTAEEIEKELNKPNQ